jgi:hypothetical protein
MGGLTGPNDGSLQLGVDDALANRTPPETVGAANSEGIQGFQGKHGKKGKTGMR